MKHTALLLLLATACSKPKHLPECDDFQKVADKLEKCPALPDSAKASIKTSNDQLKDMFKKIDDLGGIDSAPKDLQDTLRDTCKTQGKAIVDAYAKAAPDCLK